LRVPFQHIGTGTPVRIPKEDKDLNSFLKPMTLKWGWHRLLVDKHRLIKIDLFVLFLKGYIGNV
jgi:hypothetical protein|tara:strand:- start:337 stop:528 length:192 start_codon:yes stop_codon:yes gene_type:complete